MNITQAPLTAGYEDYHGSLYRGNQWIKLNSGNVGTMTASKLAIGLALPPYSEPVTP